MLESNEGQNKINDENEDKEIDIICVPCSNKPYLDKESYVKECDIDNVNKEKKKVKE